MTEVYHEAMRHTLREIATELTQDIHNFVRQILNFETGTACRGPHSQPGERERRFIRARAALYFAPFHAFSLPLSFIHYTLSFIDVLFVF